MLFMRVLQKSIDSFIRFIELHKVQIRSSLHDLVSKLIIEITDSFWKNFKFVKLLGRRVFVEDESVVEMEEE